MAFGGIIYSFIAIINWLFRIFSSILTACVILISACALTFDRYGSKKKGGSSKSSGEGSRANMGPERSNDFGEDFDKRVKEAFCVWAERHPNPDAPAICEISGTGRMFTAREIAREVGSGTDFGRLQLRVVRHFAMTHPDIGVEGVIKMVMGEPLRATP